MTKEQEKTNNKQQLPEKGEIYYLIRDKKVIVAFCCMLFAMYGFIKFFPIVYESIVEWRFYDEIEYHDNVIKQTMQNITLAGTDKPLFYELKKRADYPRDRLLVYRISKPSFRTNLTAVQVFDWYSKQLLKNGWKPIYNYNKFVQYAKDHNLQEQNKFLDNEISSVMFFKQEHELIIKFYDDWGSGKLDPEQGINCIYNIEIFPTEKVKMPVPEHLK